jgi:hypothetical protein
MSMRVAAFAFALRGRLARRLGRFRLCGRVAPVDSLVATVLK